MLSGPRLFLSLSHGNLSCAWLHQDIPGVFSGEVNWIELLSWALGPVQGLGAVVLKLLLELHRGLIRL